MHGVYNSSGPDGFWEHGHPPCQECLKYHEHIKRLHDALVSIKAVEVPRPVEVADIGDENMPVGEKAVTVALGRCVSLAHEALDPPPATEGG